MLREAITSSPLYWPSNQGRTTNPQPSSFRRASIGFEAQEVLAELARMGVRSSLVKISSNLRLNRDGSPTSQQRQPLDSGIAIWFEFNDQEHVLACDRWMLVEHNFRAITLHINATRGMERWGVGSLEQAFRGFLALPENASRERPWREILGLPTGSTVTRAQIDVAWKRCARDAHPDMDTGWVQRWYELKNAYEAAKRAIG